MENGLRENGTLLIDVPSLNKKQVSGEFEWNKLFFPNMNQQASSYDDDLKYI